MAPTGKLHRKQRATSVITDESVMKLHGQFLRALRNRAGLTCEQLAGTLSYKRPTQVIRREAGFIGIPLSEIVNVAKHLKCTQRLLLFARILAFETPYYRAFGNDILGSSGPTSEISPAEFFERQIAKIGADYSEKLWGWPFPSEEDDRAIGAAANPEPRDLSKGGIKNERQRERRRA
jgi:hypothetical protein